MNIDTIASLLATHKLIPFMGAGCSKGHLNTDWKKLTYEMAQEINSESENYLEIAEEYLQKKGEEEFYKFLKTNLYVDAYNEELDITHLAIINTGIGLIYTTNQDNVLEKCIQKYGRKYNCVYNLEHLGAHKPGNSMLIKYHGDLEAPDSVIFTKSSYENRIQDVDHFLNIKIRSDLLAKGFLFVGYSFSDLNIQLIFKQLKEAFRGKIPPSYFIAFEYDEKLKKLAEEYGITIINPKDEITDAENSATAFEKYISALCEETQKKKVDEEISSWFRSDIPPAIKTISKYDVSSMEQALQGTSDLSGLIDQFRITFDAAQIPDVFQQRVSHVFLELCKRCDSREKSDNLKAALFNLHLGFDEAITAVAGVWTTALYRESKSGFDPFSVIAPNFPDEVYPYAIGRSIELIREWGLEMNDAFRSRVTMRIEGYNTLPEDAQNYIKAQINWAWSTRTTYENPIRYWERLGHKKGIDTLGFDQIRARLEDSFPKKSSKPYEE